MLRTEPGINYFFVYNCFCMVTPNLQPPLGPSTPLYTWDTLWEGLQLYSNTMWPLESDGRLKHVVKLQIHFLYTILS